MRCVLIFVTLSALAGCGPAGSGGSPADGAKADDGGDDGKGDGDETPFHSQLVANAAALPACNTGAEGWLVYLKAEGKFQACVAGSWGDVSIKGDKGEKGDAGVAGNQGVEGDVGASGVTISAVENILELPSNDDLCTRYSNEVCYFRGGIVTRYSSGLVQFTGMSVYSITIDIGGGKTDTDHDWNNVGPTFCSPSYEWCSLRLRSIARTGSDTYRALWLLYFPSTKSFALGYDTNNNGVFEEGTDEGPIALTTESMEID